MALLGGALALGSVRVSGAAGFRRRGGAAAARRVPAGAGAWPRARRRQLCRRRVPPPASLALHDKVELSLASTCTAAECARTSESFAAASCSARTAAAWAVVYEGFVSASGQHHRRLTNGWPALARSASRSATSSLSAGPTSGCSSTCAWWRAWVRAPRPAGSVFLLLQIYICI